MKALKKNSALYLEQVASAVAECYEKDESPAIGHCWSFIRIGQCICRQGEKAFIPHLAEMLANRFPSLKGFSLRNLRRMRDFYYTLMKTTRFLWKNTVPWLDTKCRDTGVL